MIFRGRRSKIFPYFYNGCWPGYKYKEKYRGGVQWLVMESKDFHSNISFKIKNWKEWNSIIQRTKEYLQIINQGNLPLQHNKFQRLISSRLIPRKRLKSNMYWITKTNLPPTLPNIYTRHIIEKWISYKPIVFNYYEWDLKFFIY